MNTDNKIAFGCAPDWLYAKPTEKRETPAPIRTAEPQPLTSPSATANPYSDYYYGPRSVPSGEISLSFFRELNPKNEKLHLGISSYTSAENWGNADEPGKKGYLSITLYFNPPAWHQFTGYTSAVKKMPFKNLVSSRVPVEEIYRPGNNLLIRQVKSSDGWYRNLIVDENAELKLEFLKPWNTYAEKVTALFEHAAAENPQDRKIKILESLTLPNQDQIFLAIDELPDETPRGFYDGTNIPHRLYTGIKDKSGNIKKLEVYITSDLIDLKKYRVK